MPFLLIKSFIYNNVVKCDNHRSMTRNPNCNLLNISRSLKVYSIVSVTLLCQTIIELLREYLQCKFN